jgi:hypothetical protein
MELGPKGFFTSISTSMEDIVRIFEEYPYFIDLVGLHLRLIMEKFDP